MYCRNQECRADMSRHCDFDLLGHTVECHACGKRQVVNYEENWDEETDELDEWWYLDEPEG